MEKKYQVFVSSTYQDLIEERQEVMHALLELDCIPSGMELFPAADEAQWEVIKRVIDDCDYYILILAGRYGSIAANKISYIEMEFDYAISQNKPVIAFLHKNIDDLKGSKLEQTDEGRRRLKKFREKVEKRLCKFWTNSSELGSVVSRSLIQLRKNRPAVGWVRANQISNQEAAQEIIRLNKNISELENLLKNTITQPPENTEDLAQGDDIFSIDVTESYGFESHIIKLQTTWNEMFSFLCTYFLQEANFEKVESGILTYVWDNYFVGKSGFILNKDSISVSRFDTDTIIVQFEALGLIQQSEKAKKFNRSGTFWILTPYGQKLMNKLRAIRKDKGKVKKTK